MYELKGTTSAYVSRWLEGQRTTDGSSSLTRVVTLVAVSPSEESVAEVINAVLEVSRAHPARIIVVLEDPDVAAGVAATQPNLDAQMILGDTAGLAEIVILRPSGGAGTDLGSLVMPLVLPDTPLIAWWPQDAPASPSQTSIGQVAQRRITHANSTANPRKALGTLAEHYSPGDTDLTWAGLTIWRGHLASLLDEPPHEQMTHARIVGNLNRGGAHLLGAWLELRLGVELELVHSESAGIDSVTLVRADGELAIERPAGSEHAVIRRPNRKDLEVTMPLRSSQAMLIEELRMMGEDREYREVLGQLQKRR
ncbi:glucose-6-phosphate dehydrogenase assembly protein OpcA [Arcanobacterium wilhelmae]|uniref:Glucose-6-phosphate dehydrogenase assembly protein OpcA n=1 Tax=Arcanobacterium wilhelmae TaxID=1803177 RepID=A0ABT9N901_9ACTO|nr:glucose-6-phosphate dehydrogenase assembly protein OpcA [Arcanobacterium wilhelmae]MDP9799995.1 glucose-6-phosphate dehydrogenase assembly protein OpcA [Arcanobacterium wilhelmae]WFN89494.1 glucose-6-phosphate dehydrogenase assembly protein OpcA [Arcanobacterium wilhelmae]